MVKVITKLSYPISVLFGLIMVILIKSLFDIYSGVWKSLHQINKFSIDVKHTSICREVDYEEIRVARLD